MLFNLHSRKNACYFISGEYRESLSKVRQSFVTRVCVKRNRAQPRRTSSPANAMSIRDPVPGRRSSRSIFFAVITKRAAAIADHRSAENDKRQSRMLPNFWPGNDRVRPAKVGAPNSRNRSNFSTRNPKAITAMDVRTQARNVRSFSEWSLKFLIILSANMNPRNGTINIKRIGAPMGQSPPTC